MFISRLQLVCTVSSLVIVTLWIGETWAWQAMRNLQQIIMPKHAESVLRERLGALNSKVQQIVDIAGTAGLSLGVSQDGHLVHTANFGFRNVKTKTAPNADTIYPCCSLTKAMLAATAGTLVEEGKITWDTVVQDTVPDFKIRDTTIREQTTLVDLLSHRHGMSVADYYLGAENNLLVSKADSTAFISNQEKVNPFRAQMQYNNLGYELAGTLIDNASGSAWGKLMRDRIFDQLGLQRTFLSIPPKDVNNIAKAYNTLDDATPVEIPTVQSEENNFAGAAAGMRSSVSDLAKLYDALIVAANDQFANHRTKTDKNPFQQVPELLGSKIPLGGSSRYEESYALGWVRVQLPGPMGAVGCNPPLMAEGMPIVGKGAASRLVLYHQGSLPGALAAVVLLPEMRTSIVILTNSLALNDCADWVAQLLLEEILKVPSAQRNDYVQAAKVSAAKQLEWYPRVTAELNKQQKKNTSARALGEYVGTYVNEPGLMKMIVTNDEGQLYYTVNGLPSEKYKLSHYEDDVFLWIRPRNELVSRGRWVDQAAEFWKIRFRTNADGQVTEFVWVHDLDVPEGESFFRAT